MKNKSFDNDGLQFAWDSTSLNLAETCLRKYQYTMIEGWQHPSKSVHLLFGGWYATAQEHFQKYLAEGVPREGALENVVMETLLETWDHELDEEGHRIADTGTPWDAQHNTKTRENLIRTIVWYVDHFADDSLETVILSSGKAAVEYSFSLPIDNDLVLCGHIDRLVNYGGDYYVQDQKTTGATLSPHYFRQFNPHTQMSAYTFAGKMIYDLPVKGVVIDAAQIAVGFSRFERGFTFRTPAQLEEWYDDALHFMHAAREATSEARFPMNLSSCDKFGGCEFRSICSRSPEVREQFLKGEFVQGWVWDPLERR